jgi:hypothetical protein
MQPPYTITDDDVAELSIVATTQAEEDATDGLFTLIYNKTVRCASDRYIYKDRYSYFGYRLYGYWHNRSVPCIQR